MTKSAGKKKASSNKRVAAKKSNSSGQEGMPAEGDAEMAQVVLEQAKAVLTKLPMLGHILWLYSHSPFHKYVFVSDFEWLVLPPLVQQQYKLYMKNEAPIAYASWAFVSEEVEKRLLAGQTKLSPQDWKSGDRLWLIDLISPFGGTKDIVKDIRENVFPNQTVHYLVPDFEKRGVRPVEWKPIKPGSGAE